MPEPIETIGTTGPTDPEIRAERAYLDACRQALRRMREDVLSTRSAFGDVVLDKYYNEVIRRARAQRAEQPIDLASIPLFFGRLTYPAGEVYERAPADGRGHGGAALRTRDGDLVYVGRRSVSDAAGVPMVVDWRAPVGSDFYRASPKTPMGALARRRFGFDRDGALTAYEDESLESEPSQGSGLSALVTAEMERPRSGPMRDIVATIQPEQDDLVRAPLERTLCVQGAPGTGKTAVGLHRLAYLLYTARDRLRNEGGVAIIGPNRSFLTYIGDVLPALGEVDVWQTTVEDLVNHAPVRRIDDPFAARVKGDARMAEVIRRDLWSQPQPLDETLVVERGSRRWRIHPDELADILTELRDRDIGYGVGPRLLTQRIAHLVLRRMETSGMSRATGTVGQLGRDRAIGAAVRRMWPKADPVRLVLGLLTDRQRLDRAAEGVLTHDERGAIMLPGRPRGVKSAAWSAADQALIDEAAALIERPSTLGHVVVDEAQDLSPMRCRAIARRVVGSCTVLGDLAQATDPAGTGDWPTLLTHLGRPGGQVVELDRGYRVPAQVLDYAGRLLPQIAPGIGLPSSARRVPGALQLTETTTEQLAAATGLACKQALAEEGSVGLIAADADLATLHRGLADTGLRAAVLGEHADAIDAERLVCVPASLAKGLEFETVIVVEPAHIVDAEPRGLHRLYVCLTRAVSALHVVHAAPLPRPLRRAEPSTA